MVCTLAHIRHQSKTIRDQLGAWEHSTEEDVNALIRSSKPLTECVRLGVQPEPDE
jgi:hypothetical protein